MTGNPLSDLRSLDDIGYPDARMRPTATGLAVNRPVVGLFMPDAFYYETDTNLTWYSNGVSWVSVPTVATGATVATTVAGLGTVADGKVGQLRLGSSPYEFLPVIYDATRAAWMSAEQLVFDAGTVVQTYNTAALADLFAAGIVGVHPYRAFQAAGLVCYFRAVALIGKTAAGANSDMSLALSVASNDLGTAEASVGGYAFTVGTTTRTITGATVVGFDTGWVRPTFLMTVADQLTVKVRGNVTDVTDPKVWRSVKVYLRWQG